MSRRRGGRTADTVRTSDQSPNSTGGSVTREVEQKQQRILRLLVTGASLTRFDAEHHGDHCLNSTVATLGAMGVRIARKPVTLPGRFGNVRCNRYWIEPDGLPAALAFLERAQ